MDGGGSTPGPGEITLAHHGVLILDELPEFPPNVLNQLREPLEDGYLTVSRSQGRLRFPARVTLIAAMNPCPCGFLGTPVRPCRCPEPTVARYRARISGPLLDRIDLFVHVPRLDFNELGTRAGERSASVRERVIAARAVRARDATPARSADALHGEARRLLAVAVDRVGLSARGAARVVRVAQTIAYLAGRTEVETADVAEALQYRPDLGLSDGTAGS
jgi:magnesium chelatase family protein